MELKLKKVLDLSAISTKADKIRQIIQDNFVGQEEAVNGLMDVLEKYHSGMRQPNRPIGTGLFIGPTGTGKTRLVEVFCEALFGNPNACIKIDCGEFQHSHEIAKLVGSPPGYLGHRETPARLTTTALSMYMTKEYPISVVLFDEIEKASDALWHLMLGIMDKGIMTMGDNSKTDFSNSIVLMTSNAGTKEMNVAAGDTIGFSNSTVNYVDDKNLAHIAIEAAKRKFTPEFINRIDKIVCFNTLKKNQLTSIVDIELNLLQRHIYEHVHPKFFIKATNKAKEAILNEGYSVQYNARSIKRAIDYHILLPLSKAVSSGQIETGDVVLIDYKYSKYTFSSWNDSNIQLVEPDSLSSMIAPEPATEKTNNGDSV